MTEAETAIRRSGFDAGVQTTTRILRDNVSVKITEERDRILTQMGATAPKRAIGRIALAA
jgi:hypothetical protein